MSDSTNSNKDFCLEHYAQCNRCKKRACNANPVEFEKKLSCIKCIPGENSNCNNIDDDVNAIKCIQTTLGYINKCYTFHKENVSYRGCLYEASEEIFDECNNSNSSACLTCNESNCNRDPVKIDLIT